MKTYFTTINKLVLFFATALFFSSCANIIPPSGGAKDTLAPILIAALPKDSTINFNAKKITLTFNEYIETRDVQQNVVVNPLPKNQPTIEYKLHNVFVTLKDSLEPNTTYTINFGNAIKDVNEGNPASNKTYTFSTGNTIDNNTITGNVILAQDGKIDSNLVAILHPNLNDTAVIKLKPKYLVKLDGKGFFKFTNLPNATYNLFILPNDYSKKYDDSTKLFAFLNKPITTTDSVNNVTLYAYREAEIKEKNNTQQQGNTKNKEVPKLKVTTNIVNNKYDILDTTLSISFTKKIIVKNIDSIQLLDTNYKKIADYKIAFDSINSTINIKNNFTLSSNYILVVGKNAIADTMSVMLSKADTTSFTTLAETDYGNIKIRCNQKTGNAVLQVISNGKLFASLPFTNNQIVKKLFKPGEYELRILIDENNNTIWDAGNYNQKKQPEKVIALTTKLLVKANWDNEIEINWQL